MHYKFLQSTDARLIKCSNLITSLSPPAAAVLTGAPYQTDAPTNGTFQAGQGGTVNATKGGTVLIKDGVTVVDSRGNFSTSTNSTTYNVLGEFFCMSGLTDDYASACVLLLTRRDGLMLRYYLASLCASAKP
jgi:hypothetical protein